MTLATLWNRPSSISKSVCRMRRWTGLPPAPPAGRPPAPIGVVSGPPPPPPRTRHPPGARRGGGRGGGLPLPPLRGGVGHLGEPGGPPLGRGGEGRAGGRAGAGRGGGAARNQKGFPPPPARRGG